MASLCNRCALRLRLVTDTSPLTARRTLSCTSSRRSKGGLPSFTETSNPELDSILSSFRYKHFLPAALSKSERKLIFQQKNRTPLKEYPRSVTLGEEDIKLEWIDRRKDIPNRRKLLKDAVKLMSEGEKGDWENLTSLLTGLHKAKRTPTDRQLAKMIRLATNSGKFRTILQCLQKADTTGMTLKKEEVLNAVVWGLRETAYNGQHSQHGEDPPSGQDGAWTKETTSRAIRDANVIAMLLEDKAHGPGRYVPTNDSRRKPEVLSVFLELAAVYAWKFQEGKDRDGKVKAYAERLLSNIEGAEGPTTTEPAPTGPQLEMRRGIPIWHGLRLAQQILGDDMPQAELTDRIVKAWDAGLAELAKNLEAKGMTKPGSYGAQALTMRRDAVQNS